MARAFRAKNNRYLATLEPTELELLASLVEQTAALLSSAEPVEPQAHPGESPDSLEAMTRGMEAALSGPGDDPALRRLLPEAHRDDPIAAAEFRQRSGDTVRSGKLRRLQNTLTTLQAGDGSLDLSRDQAAELLVSLTDIRLVLGERLGLRTDDDADSLDLLLEESSPDDPRVNLVLAYDFLTWLQESLAIALTG